MTDPYGGTILRIVRDDGETIVADGQWSGGWAVEWDGLADFLDLPIDLSTSANVLSDGSTLVSKRVAEAERTATIVYAGPRDPAQVRDEALAFFNPKHSFEVHVTHLGRTRWCEGELAACQCVIQPSRYPCRMTFTLLCLDPYMRSEDGNFNSLTDEVPMFGFPFVSHVRQVMPDGSKKPVGSLASKTMYDGLNTVMNSGDVKCGYRIVCHATEAIRIPRFEKDGRKIQVNVAMKEGDELVIDFQQLPPKVTLNGTNVIGACSRDSNFVDMEMAVGENIFTYDCETEGGRGAMDVQIQFYKRYLGV